MSDTAFDPEMLITHARALRALAQRLVADPGYADDIVQETWIAAWRGPPRQRPSLRAWLMTVARHVAMRRDRAARRHEQVERRAARVESVPATDAIVEREATRRLLIDAVLALAEPYRSVIALRYFDDLPPRTIAARLAIPVETVRTRVKRGLDLLRVSLDQQHGGDRRAWVLTVLPLARRAMLVRAAVATTVGGLLVSIKAKLVLVTAAVLLTCVTAWLAVAPKRPHASDEPIPVSTPIELPVVASAANRSEVAPSESADPATDSAASPAIAVARLTGRVLTPAGDSLVGERVSASIRTASGSSRHHPGCKTGARGEYALEIGFERKESQAVTLEIEPRGWSPFRQQLNVSPGEAIERDLIVRPLVAVTGRVQDRQGQPIRAAWVFLMYGGMPARGNPFGPLTGTWSADRAKLEKMAGVVRSDADGQFRLAMSEQHHATVWAIAEGMGYAGADIGVSSTDHDLPPLTLVLESRPAPAVLEGIVLDAHGQPAVAQVRCSSEKRRQGGESGRDGRFHIELRHAVPQDVEVLDAKTGRYAETRTGVAPGTRDLVFQLRDPGRIRLDVTDTAGTPVEEYLAIATLPDRRALFNELRGSMSTSGPLEHAFQVLAEHGSDPSKTFEYLFFTRGHHELGACEMLVPGRTFSVAVIAHGYVDADVGPFAAGALHDTLHVKLARRHGVRGTTILADGSGVPARVTLHRAVCHHCFGVNGFAVRSEGNPVDTTQSSADGSFTVFAKERGSYYVRAEREGFAPAEIGPIAIDPAHDLDEVEIEMNEGGTLAGRVLVAPGREAKDVIVGISRADGVPLRARPLADGSYRFEHLCAGPWLVRETRESSSFIVMGAADLPADHVAQDHASGLALFPPRSTCEVKAGLVTTYDLDLRLPYPRVTGTLLLDGVPARMEQAYAVPTSFVVAAVSADLVPEQACDEHGGFAVSVREPGDWELRLTAQVNGASIEVCAPVHLESAIAWRRDVPLGRITGRVPLDAERPESMWVYTWKAQDLSGKVRFRLAADGSFSVPAPASTGHLSPEFGRDSSAHTISVAAGVETIVDPD